MKKLKKLWIGLALAGMLSFVLAGCSSGEDKKLTIAYVAWDSEIASNHVVAQVLETKLGYEVELLQVDAGPMWQGVSDGSADAMVAAWLPTLHNDYLEKYGDTMVDLGANLDGTISGLTVPQYVDLTSIEDLNNAEVAKQFDGTIVGIEPGAGIMTATTKVLEEYGLDDWTLMQSSSGAMAQALQDAYEKEEPIIVTGWTPHWMFGAMDLKYLEDPKGVYGGAEQIHTFVRDGLEEDHPDAYKFLDQFNWTADDMSVVMVDILNGASGDEAAKAYIDSHPDQVDAWLAGIDLE